MKLDNFLLKLLIITMALIQYPIKVFSQQEDLTPSEQLLRLSEEFHIDDYIKLQELIGLGAEINSVNSNGVSPLISALQFRIRALQDKIYISSITNKNKYEDIIQMLENQLDKYNTYDDNDLKASGEYSERKVSISLEGEFSELIESINSRGILETRDEIKQLINKLKNSLNAPYVSQKIIDLLILNGSNIDFPNKNGLTPLQSAVENRDYLLSSSILTFCKPNINLLFKDGTTMLERAYLNDDLQSFKVILKSSAHNVLVCEKWESVLRDAIKSNNIKWCQVLINNGVDTNLMYNEEITILQKAIEDNNYILGLTLLRNGADIEQVNKNIQSVETSTELKALLKEYGATFKIRKIK
ncbi:hypothetical protein [uncultured Draconibacterium sp.]|uniref:hypothetical protein n=1 Tax=uncultured Draconibacterium sp. TaxID=1573823 RepID=UPI003216F9BE